MKIDSGELSVLHLVFRGFFVLIFLIGGAGKLIDLNGFVESTTALFETSPLPVSFAKGFLYILPFLEIIPGIMLLLNYKTKQAVIFLCSLLIVLAFGEMMLMRFDAINRILIDVIGLAILYWLTSLKSHAKAKV